MASSARLPPSPRLLARMVTSTYLTETMMLIDQKNQRQDAQDVAFVDLQGMLAGETFMQGVKRACADIAIDDSECAHQQCAKGRLFTAFCLGHLIHHLFMRPKFLFFHSSPRVTS